MKTHRTQKWHKKITLRELQHLADTQGRGPTLRGLIANRKFHKSEIAAGRHDPCFECRIIAQKLGLE